MKERFLEVGTNNLLDVFTNELIQNSQAPTQNIDILKEILSNSITSGEPINMVSVGCVNWVKPSWAELDNQGQTNLRLIKPPNNKRVKAFAKEIANLQTSMKQFGIESNHFVSISNIEPLVHIRMKNMGLSIENDDAEKHTQNSTNLIIDSIKQSGGHAQGFDHLQTLSAHYNTSDLNTIQGILTNGDITMRNFLDGLYSFDLSTLPTTLGLDKKNTIWLDIQSTNFSKEVRRFRSIAKEVSPDLPIIGPTKNSGNWGSKNTSPSSFSTPLSFIQEGFSKKIDPTRIKDTLHRQSDNEFINILGLLGISIGQINSIEQKSEAVSILMQLIEKGV